MRDKKVITLHYANNLKLFALCMLRCLIIHSIFKKRKNEDVEEDVFFVLYNFDIIVRS